MKFKKITFPIFFIVLLVCATPQKMLAQWSIGGSYEIRNEKPKNGFGVRLERDILQKLPIINLGLRAHFSYFSENNKLDTNGATYDTEIKNYDYGLAAVGGVSVGLISPYVGLGLGSENADFNVKNASLPGEGSDNNLYWNGFVGAKVSPIPVIKPFVEYRISSTKKFKDLNNSVNTSDGRLIFGVSLAF
ncbi:MAG TPA: outer membrane beta-barrel protein [Balneolaceae bacterium]|nr:outer membrane beta-barrel protein [Balneolaceae bacterium]